LIHQKETLEGVELLVVMAVEVEQQLLALTQVLLVQMLEVVQEEQVLQ
jgi:hypothetical protein|tara:strand:- start:303 stop:446 length:144 start_codon:yes stop_codon:yes gene_type:complete